MNIFIETISTENSEKRNRSFSSLISNISSDEILKYLRELEDYRKKTGNLYERVRSCMFLYSGYNYLVHHVYNIERSGHIPYEGYNHLLERRYEESIKLFLHLLSNNSANAAICSALSKAYHMLTFKILADQVNSPPHIPTSTERFIIARIYCPYRTGIFTVLPPATITRCRIQNLFIGKEIDAFIIISISMYHFTPH